MKDDGRGDAQMSEFEIRLSKKEDFSQLVEMDYQMWHSANSPSLIHWDSVEAYEARCPEGSQLVAIINGQVCGYAGLHQPTPLESNSHVTELSIAVHPEYRRRGIARKLLDAAGDWAREQKKRKLSLRVLATNRAAINLYESCGFLEQGRLVEEFFSDGKYIDDVLMYKRLD